MTDHHDFGYPDDDLPFDDHPQPYEHEHPFAPDEPVDVPVYDEHPGHGWDEQLPVPDGDDTVPAVPDVPELVLAADDPVDVFPPALDVGDLPEPVDGFPWIDTGSLGVVDPAALTDPTDPVLPQELADYAGTELPPGVDPWAALADSDDPATSTLARWWSRHQAP